MLLKWPFKNLQKENAVVFFIEILKFTFIAGIKIDQVGGVAMDIEWTVVERHIYVIQ